MSTKPVTPGVDRRTRDRWRWLRAYYFEPCKDDLILDAIWPAMRIMTEGQVPARAFYQRDWVRGPNVLIGLHRSRTHAHAIDAGADLLRAYLRTHPSRTALTPGEFEAQMAPVAKRELRPHLAHAALQANNCVVIDGPAPVVPLLRDATLIAEERRFLCRSASLVVPWLASIRKGVDDRGVIARQILIALAWVASPDRLTASASFYAHAYGFLRHADPSGRLARQFEDRADGEEGETTKRLLRMLRAAPDSSTGRPAGLDAFITLARETLVRVHRALERRAITPLPIEELEPTFTFSPNVETAATQRRLIGLMNESSALRAWQITVNLTYLLLNQLGLRPLQRFLACYLVSRAAADLCGADGARIGIELARTGDATRMLPFFAMSPRDPAAGATLH
jgi:hypothetical protein